MTTGSSEHQTWSRFDQRAGRRSRRSAIELPGQNVRTRQGWQAPRRHRRRRPDGPGSASLRVPRRGAACSANMRCSSSGWSALALLVNSGFDFWFSYEENKAALFRVQQEKAGIGGAAHRRVRRRDRAPDRLDDACAMGGGAARPAPPGLCPPAAPGAGDHRADPARRRRARSSSRSRGWRWTSVGSEKDFSQSPAFIEAKAAPRLVQPGLFPQGIRAVHDAGDGARRPQRRRHRRRGQSEADLGRHHRA